MTKKTQTDSLEVQTSGNIVKKSKRNKVFIILSCVFSLIIVALLCIYFIAGNYFFNCALSSSFDQFKAVDKETLDKIEEMPLPETDRNWFRDVEFTFDSIRSKDDGYKLNAFIITQKDYSHKWVISIHGYRGKALDNGKYAKEFYAKGFNVILPDLEGHGFSEGKYVGMGYYDKNDILGWIDYIIKKDPYSQIVLHGVSMGGATVMMTTGEELPTNVKCAIEDCGYSNVYDIFKHVANEYLNYPFKRFLLSSLDFYAKNRLGIHLKQANCVKALKKSTTPTLFIHGTEDNFVPFEMLDVVYNANPDLEKEKLVVEGANHAYSATYNPELYFGKVFEFVNKYVI